MRPGRLPQGAGRALVDGSQVIMVTGDAILVGGIAALFLWSFVLPLVEFAAVDSNHPTVPPKRWAVLQLRLTIVLTGVAAAMAWKIRHPFSPTLLMVFFGVLLGAAYADPSNVTRVAGEPLTWYGFRYLEARLTGTVRGKVVALLATLVVPFFAPASWYVPVVCVAMVLATRKAFRCWNVEGADASGSAREAIKAKWMQRSQDATGRCWALATGPAIVLFQSGEHPRTWSALAGFSLATLGMALASTLADLLLEG